MPPFIMPLSDNDFQVLGLSRKEFQEVVESLPNETRHYVVNSTHRLAEVNWIHRELEEQLMNGVRPAAHEGLLSLQIFLLLTCADTLGHMISKKGAGSRFRTFFQILPQETKESLIEGFFVWKTNFEELSFHGLTNNITFVITYPRRYLIHKNVQTLESNDRFNSIVDFLYLRWNYYTRETHYPKFGYDPNLSVIQMQRLNIPNTRLPREQDRIQLIVDGSDFIFIYYETDDVVNLIRQAILNGLGQIIGSVYTFE